MRVAICVFSLLASAVGAQVAPSPPTVVVSGVLFANFQYRGDASGNSANRFDVERAYLNFQTPVREKLSVRVTTDLFQQTSPGSDSFYRGWVVRAKYAYLNYDFVEHVSWRAWARAGLLQTVFIEHDEKTWPRWISTTPTERAGYFSSADAGLSTSLVLAQRLVEVYATVTNGPGYTSREVDRFKDVAARLTVAPWARDTASFLRGVSLSAWGYKGYTASRFSDGGAVQLGAVGSGLARDRFGVQIASGGSRLAAALQHARRVEETETGSNTQLSPRAVRDTTGSLTSAYVIVRPFANKPAGWAAPLSLLARFDRVTANRETGSRYNVVIGGLIWDLSKSVSLSLDYQETTPVTLNPVAPVKTYFAHLVARF